MKVSDIKLGNIYTTNAGFEYEVMERIGSNKTGTIYRIKFKNTGYIKDVYTKNIKSGEIRDPYEPQIAGVGYMGDAVIKGNERYYNIWRLILNRCYNPKDKDYPRYGNMGITVDPRWFNFDNFRKDMPYIDGYNPILFLQGKLFLDKDVKQAYLPKNNRIYSKDTCAFITEDMNNEYRDYCQAIASIDQYQNIIRYEGVRDCARKSNVSTSDIISCLTGDKELHKGLKYQKYAMTRVPIIEKSRMKAALITDNN